MYLLIKLMVTFNCENRRHQGNAKEMLVVTTGVLVVNILFPLRSASLYFANFAGEMIVIFVTLVPFFLGSILLLSFFTYAYKIVAKLDSVQSGSLIFAPECEVEFEDTMTRMKDNIGTMTSIHRYVCVLSHLSCCFRSILQGFFSGTK